jgi:hypothetical protein
VTRPALKEERAKGHGHISNNPHVFREIWFKNRSFPENIKENVDQLMKN